MPLSVTGSKTVPISATPQINSAVLTTLFATPVENLKVGDLKNIKDALRHLGSGAEPNKTLGTLFQAVYTTGVSVTGTKTVGNSPAPHLPAATLTTLLATPVENLKVKDLDMLEDATTRVAGGSNPNATIGSILV